MGKRMRRMVMLLMASMVVFAGCGGASGGGDATPTPFPTPVVPTKPTYEVQRGSIVKTLQFTGRVAPVVEEELFFRTSGYVETVYVSRDDMVDDGNLLAELETTDLENQLAQAEADLEAMRLSTESRLAEAQAALNTAEVRLTQARINDPGPQVAIAEVDLERAQIALADAQEEHQKALDRVWEPEEVREATAYVLHQQELNLKVAEARYQQAIQSSQSHYYDIELLEQDVALAQLYLDEVEVGADVQRAELAVARLEDLLADAQVIAPFDGRILALSLTEGRMVDAYRQVMIIADMDELEVSADLGADEMEELAEGMRVTMVLSNRPGVEFEGEIRTLPYPYGGGGIVSSSSSGESDRSTRILLDGDPAELGLEVGNAVQVTVILEQKDDVLWLPPEAVRSFEGRDFVVVVEDDGQRRVDVTLGIEAEEKVEIRDGLTEGQIVIGQ